MRSHPPGIQQGFISSIEACHSVKIDIYIETLTQKILDQKRLKALIHPHLVSNPF